MAKVKYSIHLRHREFMWRSEALERKRWNAIAYGGSLLYLWRPAGTRISINVTWTGHGKLLLALWINAVAASFRIFGDRCQPEIERLIIIVVVCDLLAIRRPDRLTDVLLSQQFGRMAIRGQRFLLILTALWIEVWIIGIAGDAIRDCHCIQAHMSGIIAPDIEQLIAIG